MFLDSENLILLFDIFGLVILLDVIINVFIILLGGLLKVKVLYYFKIESDGFGSFLFIFDWFMLEMLRLFDIFIDDVFFV